MSKQSDAKKAQKYSPKPESRTCSNCRHLTYDMEFPAWVVEANERSVKFGEMPLYSSEEQKVQKNIRCAIGDFAVKKLATCKEFERAKK